MSQLQRWSGYLFWDAAGLVLALGVDRLLIHPFLAPHLGKEVFGAFIWVLGIVNLFGSAAANGFSIVMLRELAQLSPDAARRMVRTSLLLAFGLSTCVLASGSAISYFSAEETVRAHRWALYIPLVVYAILRSLNIIVVTELRIRRKFRTLFLLRALEPIILLLNLALADRANVWLIGGIYIASVTAPLVANVLTRRQLYGRGHWFDSGTSRYILRGWWGGAAMTLTEEAQVYGSRIIVGSFWPSGEVAVLYAGTSIGNLFVSPIGIIGGLILALLSAAGRSALRGRNKALYLYGTFALALATGAISYYLGRWIIRWAYPEFADITLGFYPWIAIANAFTAGMLMLRPVAIRFQPLRRATVTSISLLLIQLVALGIGVPKFAAPGAAVALAISAGTAFLLWLRLYFQCDFETQSEEQPDAQSAAYEG